MTQTHAAAPSPDVSRGNKSLLMVATVMCVALSTCSMGSAEPEARRTAPVSVATVLPGDSEIVVGGSPCGITRTGEDVWVSDLSADRVVRISSTTRTVLNSALVGASPCWLLGTDEGLWVAPSEEGFVQLMDPVTGNELGSVTISSGPADAKLAVADGDLWATSTPDGELVRIDQGEMEVTDRINVGRDPRSVTLAKGLLWVAAEGSNRIAVVDPTTNKVVRRFRVQAPSAIIAIRKGSMWIAQLVTESVVRVDVSSGRITKRFDIAGNLQPGIVVDGQIWSPDHLNDSIYLFPTKGNEVATIEAGLYPSAITRVGAEIWIANYGDGTVSIVEPQ